MANQLLLPPQKFNYKEITDQFPTTGNPKKKVFFQAELRSLANGNATFGIVAYASWNYKGKWEVSSKPVKGVDVGTATPIPFIPPVAFANNEVVVSFKLKKKKNKNRQWNRFEKLACKLLKDQKSLDKATLPFETSIFKNPHLEYNVTLEVNGTTLSVATKPCPPASPES